LKESCGKYIFSRLYLLTNRMGYNSREKCEWFVEKPTDEGWKDVKIIAFEAPQAKDKPYSERLNLLRQSNLFYLFYL
jgi:hypothetical protein